MHVHLEGWVGVWQKKERMGLWERSKGRGREGEWWALWLAPLVEAYSSLNRLGEWRKVEGGWRALGLAPLVEVCSSLGELGGQRKGGGHQHHSY